MAHSTCAVGFFLCAKKYQTPIKKYQNNPQNAKK